MFRVLKVVNFIIVALLAFLVLSNCNNSKESDRLSYLKEIKNSRLNNKKAHERLKEEVAKLNGYLKKGMTNEEVKKYLEENGWDPRKQAYILEYEKDENKSNTIRYGSSVNRVFTTYYCKDSLGSATLIVRYIVLNYCRYVDKFNCFIGEPKNVKDLVKNIDIDKPIVSMNDLREEIEEINDYIEKGITANEVKNFLKSIGWDTLHNFSKARPRGEFVVVI